MTQRPALSRSAVDRAAALRLDVGGLARVWRENGRLLVLDTDLRAAVEERPDGPGLMFLEPAGELADDAYFLGMDAEGNAYFARIDQNDTRMPRAGLREVGAHLDDRDTGLLVHAVALARWHLTHIHCPRCGGSTVPAQGGTLRVCPADASEHYPRTDPAVLVLVTDPDEEHVLLARAAGWAEERFSCLAGFIEAGESAEQAVVREVAEEVGLTVSALHYVSSQPWPFPSSLMLGFRAAVDYAPPSPEQGEIADARWYSRGDIQAALAAQELLLPPEVSIARKLVDAWLNEE